MIHPYFERFNFEIWQATTRGYIQRRARQNNPCEYKQYQKRMAEERFQDILYSLPRKITDAVLEAESLPVQCNVMFVQPGEYLGSVYSTFTPDSNCLAGAAWSVYTHLMRAGHAPTLEFKIPPVQTMLNPIGQIDQLCVCIAVHPLKGVEWCAERAI